MNPQRRIGIDLGGTNCRAALVSGGGEVLESLRMETRIDEGLEDFLDRLRALCLPLVEGGGASAVGIGVPGLIGADGTVIFSPNLLPLNGVPFAERLGKMLGLPVCVVNDADAVGWGEALFGAGRELDSFVTLTLGTGVGGAMILNRRLWRGADGAAGEVGHMMVEAEGRPCPCGSRGCLEQYASATGIVQTARSRIEAGQPSVLADGERLDSEIVAEAARGGDRLALAAFEEAGLRLGQVLAGVANLLNLDGAVITGGASRSLDLILPALQEELFRRAFEIPARRLSVLRGELGDAAGVLGAAYFAAEGSWS